MNLNQKLQTLEAQRDQLAKSDFSELEKHHAFYTRAAMGSYTASMKKAKAGTIKTFCEGLLGGIFISIGYIVAMTAMNQVAAAGVRQLIFGVTFPVGMLLVTFLGGGLYTSHCLGFLNAATKNVSAKQYAKNLFLMFFANFLGCFLAAVIAVLSGIMFKLGSKDIASGYGQESMNMVLHKIGGIGAILEAGGHVDGHTMGMTFLNCLASAIFCNILVGGSLYLTFSSENAAASVLLIFIAIFAFCVAGFQHVVANCFMFWVDIFSVGHAMIAGHTGALLPGISVAYFLGFNLLPAFIGNFIGGALLIPVLGYFVNKKTIDQLNNKLRLASVDAMIAKLQAELKK